MDQGATGQNLVLNLTRCCISSFTVSEIVKHMGSEASLVKPFVLYLITLFLNLITSQVCSEN